MSTVGGQCDLYYYGWMYKTLRESSSIVLWVLVTYFLVDFYIRVFDIFLRGSYGGSLYLARHYFIDY